MTQKIKLIGFAALVIVIGTTLGTAGFLAARRAERMASSVVTLPSQPDLPTPIPSAPETPYVPPYNNYQDVYNKALVFHNPPVNTKATVVPAWTSDVRKISFEDFFGEKTLSSWEGQLDAQLTGYLRDARSQSSFYVNGSTTYNGKKYSVAVFISPCDGMCFAEATDVVLLDEQSRTVLVPTQNGNASNIIIAFFTPAPNLTVTLPDLPTVLELTNGTPLYQTQRCPIGGCRTYSFVMNTDIVPTVIGKTADGIEILKFDGNTFIAIAPNGMRYGYTTSLIGENLNNGYDGTRFDVTWKSGYENANTYMSVTIGGCGGLYGPNVIAPELVGPASHLIAVGTTKNGEILLIPKNYSTHQLTKNVYDEWYPLGGDGTKPDMAGFLAQKKVPYFLWKDGLGRWIEYKSSDLQPMAECGKPVVYLYPTVTTPVHVQLPSFIRVTKSEPAYPARGWNVVAQPNGSLTNSDGTVWPNLYWDGVGVNYPDARDGFVVKDGEVAAFFAETLPKYGLNAQETKDFTEFWLPYFSGAKYYRISFLTSEWSEAAPMNVSPRPDTSIRIFMDWQKLAAPISITAPTIVTPQRDGFTLVEWGGEIPR